MVIGGKLYSGHLSGGGGSAGGIPKSPSFHSSLELAEATGRQIVSPENCNYFTFTTQTTTSLSTSTINDMVPPPEQDQPNTANSGTKIQTNGFVAKTIQNFTRFQGTSQNNQSVDKENNSTPLPPLRSINNIIDSNNTSNRNNTNSLSVTEKTIESRNDLNNGVATQLTKLQSDNIGIPISLKPVITNNGSPSRTRDRNNLNDGLSPNTAANGIAGISFPPLKGH